MDEKISLEAIGQYGDRYSEKVLQSFFSTHDRITGPEILNLTNVQQVNLFVIHELFKAWKEDQKKIRSPYFDYDDPAVKDALDQLMKLLSQKISIDSTNFEPLLKKAVRQSLLVIFDPYDYFSMLITGKDNRLEVSEFREEIRYLRVNKAPLEKLLQTLEEKAVTTVSGNEAFGILDQILEEVNFHPDDVEQYIGRFSSVHPLDPNTFFITTEVEKSEAPVNTTVTPEFTEEVVAPKVEPEPIKQPIYEEKQTASKPTLNEQHVREPRPTLADNFKRIAKIKESLTINQKFMFTKVLFHGDFELFSRAVERLDQFDSLNAALRYLEDEHASTWDRESEEFHEFMELVEKRFA